MSQEMFPSSEEVADEVLDPIELARIRAWSKKHSKKRFIEILEPISQINPFAARLVSSAKKHIDKDGG